METSWSKNGEMLNYHQVVGIMMVTQMVMVMVRVMVIIKMMVTTVCLMQSQ